MSKSQLKCYGGIFQRSNFPSFCDSLRMGSSISVVVFGNVLLANWLLVLLLCTSAHSKRPAAPKYPAGSPRGPDYCDKSQLFAVCDEPAKNDRHLFCNCDKYRFQLYEPSLQNLTDFRLFNMHWHNHFRNKIALGEETNMTTMQEETLPPASNMIALSYDYLMEDGARCHAKKGVFTHEMCHLTPLRLKYGGGGQNMYWTKSNKEPKCITGSSGPIPDCDENHFNSYEILAYRSIYSWYEEIKNLPNLAQFIDHFDGVPSVNETENLIALIWAETEGLGCSAATDGKNYQYTCHYWPAGAFVHHTTYRQGSSATQCPQEHPAYMDRRYPGLCGRSELPPEPPPDFFISLVGIVNRTSTLARASLLSLVLRGTLLIGTFFIK